MTVRQERTRLPRASHQPARRSSSSGEDRRHRQLPQTYQHKGLSEFLGMVYFYHRFIPKSVYIMGPLFAATSGKPRPTDMVEWTDAMSKSFTNTKNMLTDATVLHYPVVDAFLLWPNLPTHGPIDHKDICPTFPNSRLISATARVQTI